MIDSVTLSFFSILDVFFFPTVCSAWCAMEGPITTLPSEIFEHVLSYLDYQSLRAATSVTKRSRLSLEKLLRFFWARYREAKKISVRHVGFYYDVPYGMRFDFLKFAISNFANSYLCASIASQRTITSTQMNLSGIQYIPTRQIGTATH